MVEVYIRKREVSQDMVEDAARRTSSTVTITPPVELMSYPRKKWYHRLLGERWFVRNVEAPWRQRNDFRQMVHEQDERLIKDAYILGYMRGYADSDSLDFVHMRCNCGECGKLLLDSRNFVKVYIEPSVLDMLEREAQRYNYCGECEEKRVKS